MGIDKNISGPFVEVYEKLIFTKSMILGQWTGASVSSPGGGISYSSSQMAWEVIEKKDDYKLAYHWFPTKHKAEDFCLGRIQSK